MNIDEMHASNARAWDEAAAHYETEIQADIEFLRAGGKNFCSAELAYLGELARWCGRAIHLQCAGGCDTLSLWNLGAQSVVGVDINSRMLACAAAKAQALVAPAQWCCSDILHTPHELDATADLVYTGPCALCWRMDLKAWAQVIARLLKPGGKLYVFDGHPLDWLWHGTSTHYCLEADAVSYAIMANGSKVSVMTDIGSVTASVVTHLRDSNIVYLESNHDVAMLEQGPYPEYLKGRILSDRGHLSNLAAARLVEEHGTVRLKHLVLSHLSESNNSRAIALRTMKEQLASRSDLGRVVVSVSGRHQPTALMAA